MDFKKVYKVIKKYNNIIIARHTGPDPDAFGSSIGLKETILNNFPNKNVKVVGASVSRFRYFGEVDKVENIDYKNTLLIVTDTPNIKRIDGANPSEFDYVIRIDHHPTIDNFANLELVDTNASSACQIIIEFIKENKLKINDSIASKLYMGLVSDTNRFLYDYTSYKTFELVAWLIKTSKIEFTKLYSNLYSRSLKEMRFCGYLFTNMIVTKNGLGYIKLTTEIINEYNVDSSTAGNLIENFNNIEEVKVIAFCSQDKDYIKCSIRSKGPIINEIASKYNGGGHIYASGARPTDFNLVDQMLDELDNLCKEN